MARIHTVSQMFIVKETHDEVCEEMSKFHDAGLVGGGFEVHKLAKAGNSTDTKKYIKMTVMVDMVVAIEEDIEP